ncbi:MAG TPA: hypothetical protein DEO84_12560, partial [candidate division Zixibacteria bacterium]|nr:hypothetical protein [candidate division Zixibacteria bacterium]
MKYFALVAIIMSTQIAVAADWHDTLDSLLTASSSARQETLISSIIKAKPDWQEVIHQIQAITFPGTPKGQMVQNQVVCIDGVTRPWVIYIPSTYDPRKPTPLMIALHGGVSRPDII